MRRLLLLLLIVFAALITLQDRRSAVFAAGYPAGWNLVAGPEGSTVSGAIDSLYTMQPGDAAYERLPVSSPLHAGQGYWAYFPNGGGLQAMPGLAGSVLALVPGQFSLIGNPSASRTMFVDGADMLIIYVPGRGYQSATAIPPGQGAWVVAPGEVVLRGDRPERSEPVIITPQQVAAEEASVSEPQATNAAPLGSAPQAQPDASASSALSSAPADNNGSIVNRGGSASSAGAAAAAVARAAFAPATSASNVNNPATAAPASAGAALAAPVTAAGTAGTPALALTGGLASSASTATGAVAANAAGALAAAASAPAAAAVDTSMAAPAAAMGAAASAAASTRGAADASSKAAVAAGAAASALKTATRTAPPPVAGAAAGAVCRVVGSLQQCTGGPAR